MKTTALGEFEQMVLLAVLRCGETAYGVSVRREIETCTGRMVSPGALYTTLARMEDKGLVQSRAGEPTPERGGRAKRYVEVTKDGLAAVQQAQKVYRQLMQGLNLLEEFRGGAYA